MGKFLKSIFFGIADGTAIPAIINAAKKDAIVEGKMNWVRVITAITILILLIMVAMGKISVDEFLQIEKAID